MLSAYSYGGYHRTLQTASASEREKFEEGQRTRQRQQRRLHAQKRPNRFVGPACGDLAMLSKDKVIRVRRRSRPEHGGDDNVGNQVACAPNELDPLQGAPREEARQDRHDHERHGDEVDVPALRDVVRVEECGDAQDLGRGVEGRHGSRDEPGPRGEPALKMGPEEGVEAGRAVHFRPAVLCANVGFFLCHAGERADDAPGAKAGDEDADEGGAGPAVGERDDGRVGVGLPGADDDDAEEEDG